MIKQEMQMKSFCEDLDIRCDSCKKKNHFLAKCPLLHYIPDKDFILSKLRYTQEQTRKEHKRRQLKFMNALKHQNSIRDDAKSFELSSESESDDSDDDSNEETENYNIHEKTEINRKQAAINLEAIHENDEHIEESSSLLYQKEKMSDLDENHQNQSNLLGEEKHNKETGKNETNPLDLSFLEEKQSISLKPQFLNNNHKKSLR